MNRDEYIDYLKNERCVKMTEARPFEEYKEMIQDMSKEEMIKGLYDLSGNIIEKGNKLQRIENYLDKQHDIPIELLVNIKNIIHSEGDEK